jgi:hypothetical protein
MVAHHAPLVPVDMLDLLTAASQCCSLVSYGNSGAISPSRAVGDTSRQSRKTAGDIGRITSFYRYTGLRPPLHLYAGATNRLYYMPSVLASLLILLEIALSSAITHCEMNPANAMV